MPRLEAVATSVVLYPAPARTTSDSDPASSIGPVTVVLRTTSTSAAVSRIAAARASSLSSGLYTTSQPAAVKPSMPLRSNVSAIRTLIKHEGHSFSYEMNQQAVSQLRFEPGRLGTH